MKLPSQHRFNLWIGERLISFIFVFSLLFYFLFQQHQLEKQNSMLVDELLFLEEYYSNTSTLFNKESFILEEDFIPIVAYVYNRPSLFSQVVEALSNVKGIEKTMLIISHDRISPEMWKITRGIKFCQVRLLIHPTSPLESGNTRALTNHWWWIQHKVRSDLLPDHNGDIAFIEEDHRVSPDFYETLKVMSAIKQKGIIDNCTFVAAGSWNTEFSINIMLFESHRSFHNTGYAFNRSVWNQIVPHQQELLNSDINDWDTCLVTLLLETGRIPYGVITPGIARVVNIGVKGGLHSGQYYARLLADGKFPYTTDPNPDWAKLHVVEGGFVRCQGSECVSTNVWNQLYKSH